MTKKINPNLTAEQKLIYLRKVLNVLDQVSLIMKKGKEVFIVQTVVKNYLIQKQNMRVDQAGLLFMNLCLTYLKPKQITT